MSTDAVTAAGLRTLAEYQKQSQADAGKTGLDMDDFLKLMVAQMSYQDPLGSSSGSGGGADYITQMAQMTMLEQFSELNSALSGNQAYGMIGKYVYLAGEAGSDPLLGKVDGVINESGEFYLMVGGQTYDLSAVLCVVGGDNVASDDEILQSAGLIGKTVTAKVMEDGEESTVTGKVDKILVKDGVIHVVIDDEEIPLSNITEISAEDAE